MRFIQTDKIAVALLSIDNAAACLVGSKDKNLCYLHVSGGRGGKEDAVGYVIACEGLYALIDVVGALFVAVEADNREVGFNESGLDGGHTDGGVSEVHAESVGEGFDGGFCGAIDGSVRIGGISGDTAYVDDMSTVAGYHTRDDKARDAQKSLDIGVNHRVPIGEVAFVLFLETERQSCVIDEDIDVLPFSGEVSDLAFCLLAIAHVEGEDECARAVLAMEVVGEFAKRLLATGIEDELIAVGGEFVCASHSYS